MRFALPALLAMIATGCGGSYTASLPDGGRGRVSCLGDAPSVPVTVLDKAGQPAPNATVTAVYLAYDVTQSLTANVNGLASVPAQFGPGVVRVKGSVNDLVTGVADINFVGGDCVNAVSPRQVTLQLQ